MGVHKLTAGDGYTYLTRSVAAADVDLVTGDRMEAYYGARGESPGVWVGTGLAGLAVDGSTIAEGSTVTEKQMRNLFGTGRHPDAEAIEDRVIEAGGGVEAAQKASALGKKFLTFAADSGFKDRVARAAQVLAGEDETAQVSASEWARVRTSIARTMFAEQYGRAPQDDAELNGFVARVSRPAKQATSGYDLTFSPVKSVSVLWALAPRDLAEQIQACHEEAVAGTLAWIEREATFTRQGSQGVKQVETNGLLAAMFVHRDSRAGDPDLHTHVAISNKVQARDGSWLSLDGRMIFRAGVAASERYNSRLEGLMRERLGVEFAPVGAGREGKRVVREVVGVAPELLDAWSARRSDIEARQAELAEKFTADHGRAPSPVESLKLAQQATLETRPDKPEARSLAQQRSDWAEQARVVLGGPEAVEAMLAGALGRGRAPGPATSFDVDAVAADVRSALEAGRSWWRETNVRAEVERAVRDLNLPASRMDDVVSDVVKRVLHGPASVLLTAPENIPTPTAMRRSDGVSVHEVHGSRVFTSRAVVEAEERILKAAARVDGAVIEDQYVDLALLESTANGICLNEGQVALVRELATSGRRVQLVLAPAGTGKTTAVATLARAWEDAGGDVVALAPSAAAAKVLGDDIGTQADTLAKLVHHMTPGQERGAPEWFGAVGEGTLLVVDEAGMASTADLDKVIGWALERGASVRLLGDDRQLAAVEAGGILTDIKAGHGAVSLREVMRFTDSAEAAASLALRDGDVDAVGFYADHRRLHVAQPGAQTAQVFTAWQADIVAGKRSLMMAQTTDDVAALNHLAQTWLVTTGEVQGGRGVELADGSTAHVGDLIRTRRNDRSLTHGTGADFVKNGDRWHVQDVEDDGALLVKHEKTGATTRLPGGYVTANVDLGYASTVHAAQGSTVDTAHVVLTGTETAEVAYVALTRGREANHAYVAAGINGGEHDPARPEAIHPSTGTEVLAGIVARRDETAKSVHTMNREDTDPAALLARTAPRYADAVVTAARVLIPEEQREIIRATAEDLAPGITDHGGWGMVEGKLAYAALAGQDPEACTRKVFTDRELDTAEDPIAVLAWRAEQAGGGPGELTLPWTPALLPALAKHPEWGAYLTARRDVMLTDADDLRHHVEQMIGADDAPAWTRHVTDRALRGDVAVWRAAHQVPDTETEPVPDIGLLAGQTYAAKLRKRVDAGRPDTIQARAWWAQRLAPHVPGLDTDPAANRLYDTLAEAEARGVDAACVVDAALRQGPLPAEQGAAALRWRVEEPLRSAPDLPPPPEPQPIKRTVPLEDIDARLARIKNSRTVTKEKPPMTQQDDAVAQRLAQLRQQVSDEQQRAENEHRERLREQHNATEARRRAEEMRARAQREEVRRAQTAKREQDRREAARRAEQRRRGPSL